MNLQDHQYDSKAELAVSSFFSSLGIKRCNETFKSTFYDKDGIAFNAKPDFYHDALDIYIEYKPCLLNPKKTKTTAENALTRKSNYRAYRGQPLTDFDLIENAWSNSRHKQAIVQKELTPQKLIIIFDKLPDQKECEKYISSGLVFCEVESLKLYLTKLYLASKGLHIGFNLILSDGARYRLGTSTYN